MCVCMCIHVQVLATEQLWGSEDNLQELLLSVYHLGPRN